MDQPSAIRIFGARTHNLQQVNVSIPHGCLTVITGVSGSGKSSLAFDTIFAEGRRRYLSSVSVQSRERLQSIDRPDVDSMDGLPPVLGLEQRARGAIKRSTVATVSEIYDYLRLLFARSGRLHCPTCHQPVTSQSQGAIIEQVLGSEARQKILVLAPLIRKQVGTHAETFARIVKDGYVRARVDGQMVDAAVPPELAKSKPHDLDIVVDRLVIKEGIQSRLEESVDLALQLGRGQCVISYETAAGWQDRLYSQHLACTNCGISFPALEPRSFSFNSISGACAACEGLGSIEDPSGVANVCEGCQGTRLTDLARAVLIDGTSISDFCRLTPTAAASTVARWCDYFGTFVTDPAQMSPSNHGRNDFPRESIASSRAASQYILPEIAQRLQFLVEIGLDYLTLDRGAETLSAGEFRRTRLSASLGSEMSGVCYILDEPTAGLHPQDTARLLRSLTRLRDEGNTVLLVEHDLDVIRAADHVIDLGPGAGVLGGQVLAVGTAAELAANPASVTGRYLSDLLPPNKKSLPPQAKSISMGPARETEACATPFPESSIRLTGATLHNLKNVSIELPLHRLVCVTGVSGSGKTSLITKTLVPAIRRALGERVPPGGPFQELSGTSVLSRVICVDQSPLSRSARSSPATYSGIWDEVRRIFAKTKESRLRGFGPRQFSLYVAAAQCPLCAGRGQLSVDEQRFAEWKLTCTACTGRRFNPTTLSVRYRGQSVADVLNMSIAEAVTFFQNFPRLARVLNLFDDLGLGYLKLGQSAADLSGGEAQRIKLGTELAKSIGTETQTLFVLDEPTAGLHVQDVEQLVHLLRRLINDGHSVLAIEHNSTFVESADWQIDIGPGSGPQGGEVISVGSSSLNRMT